LHNNGLEVRVDLGNTGNDWPNCGDQHQPGFPWITFRYAWDAAEEWAIAHGATEIIKTGEGSLEWIKAKVKANYANGREPYYGLKSEEIARYSRALMFGDHDEAMPGQAAWSRIVD
jgi:hypothetical protein